MTLRVLILEDEPAAAAQLEDALGAWDASARVVGVAATVRRAVELLRQPPPPDLILADVRLADGLSLAVFDEVPVACPVIFATAHDDFVIQALERNAIDYVLKPISRARVGAALEKYARLRDHFRGAPVRALGGPRGPSLAHLAADLGAYPERVLARKGAGFVAVPVARIAWFTTEHKLTLLVDRAGARLIVDEPLGELERRLDPRRFFRLNRQTLAQADAVTRFRSGGKGKILVELSPAADREVAVSQEHAAAFRRWIAG
jgi:DNA-binding LytR/AlgR family response regulator